MAQALKGILLPDTPHRRKSRIGPGLLAKRSIGTGNASTTLNDAGQEGIPLHRSFHRTPQDSSSAEPGPLDQQQEVVSPFVSITKELESPISQLVDVFGHFVEKLESVADINAKLAQFNESFGAFLYGLKMNAENVEWTEAPTKRSFERMEQREAEAIMFQQQQEELEHIRQQRLLEQEQEKERQRIEAERLEQERLKASLSSHQSNQSNHYGGQDRQRRHIPATVTKGKGVVRVSASRIPARPNTPAAGPSRVGAGGAVRKLTGKLVMKRMVERLPLRYREEAHRVPIEGIMRSLSEHIDGQTLPELVAVAGVQRHRCNEYLGVLVHAKEIVRTNQKGVVFTLDPDRYPSRTT
ncbi:hypothetical protein BGZ65_010622 [Modicella reniformis]|uniref:DASH complex subunit DAM1 n=1 Tax=Modicella reniformis TaxID=1440133 RepID=A0A9P6MAU6_9FUNG|nr:hypothetical protein BGZ65_010622 [Modicella reniformis]